MKNKYLRKIRFKRYAKYFYIGFLCLGCFILGIYFTYSKFSVSKDTEVIRTTVGDFISGDVVIGAYINGEYSNELPKKGTGYVAEKVVCDNNAIGEWNDDEWYLITKNLTKRSKCNVYFKFGTFTFAYTGGEQKFTVPTNGVYKLETWGAQGGNNDGSMKFDGAAGGYSVGLIKLTTNNTLYINVGGQGQPGNKNGSSTLFGGAGGYNGGGTGGLGLSGYASANGGGGATHIATKSGLLSSLENFKDSILIVSGGGGGFTYQPLESNETNANVSGSGGSGYIGNFLLSEKAMYCYNCEESNEESTKTISTTCTSETPTENCAKKGNGYARITLVSVD